MRIFISYTGRHGYDGFVAETIAAAFRLRGVPYFLDRDDLHVGDAILPTIEAAIRDCTHLLLLASFASDKVEWVHQELALARAHGLQIIPAVIAARENEVPPIVRGLKPLPAPLRREVATIFQFLGLGNPPDLETPRSQAADFDFLPALCDRRDEETLYEEALSQAEAKYAGAPKFYFLVGDYRDCHELFADRVRSNVLVPTARYLNSGLPDDADMIRRVDANWPVQWPRRRQLLAVLESVVRRLDLSRRWPRAEDLTAEQIAKTADGLRQSVVEVTHTIDPERWLPETTKLLIEYARFWRDTASLMRQRKSIVVYVSVAFSPATDKVVRKRVEAAIDEIEQKTGRSRVIAPATAIRFAKVEPKAVNDWVNGFADPALALRTKSYCTALFAKEVPRHLDEVLDEFRRASLETKEKIA